MLGARLIQFLITLVIGFAGGGLFALLSLPAPWLAGSMIAASAAIALRVQLHVPDLARLAAFVVLGVQIGTTVTWDTVAGAVRWPISMAMLAVTVVLVTAGTYLFYRRIRQWNAADAFFASLPGALNLVVALAQSANADMRRVIMAQSIRLFFLVAALPLILEFLAPARPGLPDAATGAWWEILIVLAAGTAAAFVLEKLKVPAGLFVGSIGASAMLYLAGVAHGVLPPPLLMLANVVMGVAMASRFQGFTLAELRRCLADGLSGFLVALIIAAGGAFATGWLANIPYALTLIAFAPGGLDAMTIMALALNLDPAYVGAHQIIRYLALCFVLPPITAWLIKRFT